MKILHIVAGDLSGGAARGAYWLHLGLKEIGVNSRIFTNSKIIVDDDCITSTTTSKQKKALNLIRAQVDGAPAILYRKRSNRIFSSGLIGTDFTKTNEYLEADIIHLHWINGGFVNIKHLNSISKPIVWTMRDMWPMTGGCHYSMDCDNYKIGCGHCKQLNSKRELDLSKYILKRKKKYFPKHMKLVGISSWLSDKAKEAEVFRGYDVKTIKNNIDTKVFFVIDKKLAREALGIKTTKKIILCGAADLNDFYKGFNKFLEALDQLKRSKYFLCFFGKLDKNIIDNLGFEYKSYGFLHDPVSLRLVYSCADTFVAPSIMDAFGKTLAESMACGTPVVSFDATGPKDIVTHKEDGYKAKPFDSADLAVGIEWVCEFEDHYKLCNNARQKATREFDNIVVAREYKQLYKSLLS